MNAQELLKQHGINYVETRKGAYTTSCPNCNGGYLNVKIKREGVVWFCHHCGEGGGDKFEKRKRDSALGEPKAIYDYTDEAGNRLFQVLRFEPLNAPKKFRQRTGPDQDKWSIKGVRRVLYRLPELIADLAAEHVVFVVEGEKDADTLRKHGVPATTSPMGATTEDKQAEGTGWLPEYSETLRDADVVLVGDQDKQGHEHVRIVAGCLRGFARRIRLLDLAKVWPDIEVSDDISDWFKRGGGTVERLWQIVEQLPDWSPGAPQRAPADETPHGNGHDRGEASPKIITATPYVWIDPVSIEPRDFVYGGHFVRQFLSGTISMGGVGKSAELLSEIAAMVTGRDLLGIKPKRPLRVWYVNLEDPRAEIDRRLAAVWKHFGITPIEIGDRLFTDSGRDTKITIARDGKNEIEISRPTIDQVIATIRSNQIDVLAIDPFVNSSEISENDNAKIAQVCREWSMIAEVCSIALDLTHHVRKGLSGHNYTVEDARGASAMINACRSVRVLNIMSEDEAAKAGVEITAAISASTAARAIWWRRRRRVSGAASFRSTWATSAPTARLTEIGVVLSWKWPDPFENITSKDLLKVQQAVASGGPWRKDPRAQSFWVGAAIARALDLDPTDKAHAHRIKQMLGAWLKNKVLEEYEAPDQHRKPRPCVRAGKPIDED